MQATAVKGKVIGYKTISVFINNINLFPFDHLLTFTVVLTRHGVFLLSSLYGLGKSVKALNN